MLYPHKDILLYFVVPLRGRNLIYATVGGTVLFALLRGITGYVPHFVAEGLALLCAQNREIERRTSHLRPVDRTSGEEPPKWLH